MRSNLDQEYKRHPGQEKNIDALKAYINGGNPLPGLHKFSTLRYRRQGISHPWTHEAISTGLLHGKGAQCWTIQTTLSSIDPQSSSFDRQREDNVGDAGEPARSYEE